MSDGLPNDLPENEQANVSTEKDSAADSSTSLGERLAEARKAREWTVEYVASQLNLAARQIQALENENYAALPGMASVRGFVRAYAKLLKIDAGPLVALIASEQITPNLPLEPKPNLSSAPFSDARLTGGGQRKNSAKGILIAVVVVLLAAAVIGLEHMGGWPALSQSLSAQFKDISPSAASASAENKDQATDSQPVDKPENADDGRNKDASPPDAAPIVATAPAGVTEQRDTPPLAVAPTPAPVVATPVAPTAVVPKPPVVTPVSEKVESKPEAKTETKAAAAATVGQGTLVLTGRQNSWVEVRAGNNVLMSRLLKAGETEHVELTGAGMLTLGNAAGVDVVYRGQPVETKSDAKNNVARISLK